MKNFDCIYVFIEYTVNKYVYLYVEMSLKPGGERQVTLHSCMRVARVQLASSFRLFSSLSLDSVPSKNNLRKRVCSVFNREQQDEREREKR